MSELYKFGPYILDPLNYELWRGDELIQLTPKAFQVLLLFVKSNGRLIEKSWLLNEVWADSFVGDQTLSQNVFILRRVLGADQTNRQYIETVPKRGFRFIVPVTIISAGGNSNGSENEPGAELKSDRLLAKSGREDARPPEADISDDNSSALNANGEGTASEQLPLPPPIPIKPKRSEHRFWRIGVCVLALIGITVTLYVNARKFISKEFSLTKAVEPFQRVRLSNVTTLGNVTKAVISPDGKYLAYVTRDNNHQSGIWLKQVGTNSLIQVLPANNTFINGLVFSPDDKFIFYSGYEVNSNVGVLKKVPVLGGASSQLVMDVDSPITFSPDGSRIAFLRADPAHRATTLIIANADGGQEMRLATLQGRQTFSFDKLAWSPDGTMIACIAGALGGYMNLIGVRLKDGLIKEITTKGWNIIDAVAWLPDGSGLIITATDTERNNFFQLWRISYPSGDIKKITDDLNDYHGVSLTNDSDTLITVQSDQLLRMWVTRDGDVAKAEQLPIAVNGKFGIVQGLSWAPADKLVYSSNESGNLDIWMMDLSGQGRTQLTTDVHADRHPAVSSDGKHIAFVSDRTGLSELWTMDIDGTHQRQLTKVDRTGSETHKLYPRWSPDDQWIIYSSKDDDLAIWKIAASGGEPVLLANGAFGASVSPDGRLIAYFYRETQNPRWKLAVMPLEGGQSITTFEIPAGAAGNTEFLIWRDDGGGLFYLSGRDETSTLVFQPLRGGEPKKLVSFTSGLINHWAWSGNDKWAFTSTIKLRDVAMITDFTSASSRAY